jgi:hypothetical protein
LPFRLGEQKASDEETREDEEHVNADETAFEARNVCVSEEDEAHGHGAEALDVAATRLRYRGAGGHGRGSRASGLAALRAQKSHHGRASSGRLTRY